MLPNQSQGAWHIQHFLRKQLDAKAYLRAAKRPAKEIHMVPLFRYCFTRANIPGTAYSHQCYNAWLAFLIHCSIPLSLLHESDYSPAACIEIQHKEIAIHQVSHSA